MAIPKQYQACIYDAPGTISTKIVTLQTPEPGDGEVLINLTHSGVCKSDLAIMENLWKSGIPPGQVGGHEGVGKVVKLGPGVDANAIKVGDRVGIKWVLSACGNCRPCLEGADFNCPNCKVSGCHSPGTFQQYILSPVHYVTPIPNGLESKYAAPMLCAGITTYAALRRSEAKSGQWVVVSGAGGGLGHIAVQLSARSMAHRVIGIDDGVKEALVRECGAEHFIDINKHNDKSIVEEVKRFTDGIGAHAAIVCNTSNKAYAQAIEFLGVGGALVCVGVPEGEIIPIATATPAKLISKQLTIRAVGVGNRRDALEAMDFAGRGVVKPFVRTEKMDHLPKVFQELKEGKVLGRVVIDLQPDTALDSGES